MGLTQLCLDLSIVQSKTMKFIIIITKNFIQKFTIRILKAESWYYHVYHEKPLVD
jgi:hypothetical protein